MLKKNLQIEKLKFLLFDENKLFYLTIFRNPLYQILLNSTKNVNVPKRHRTKWNEYFMQQSLKLPKNPVKINEKC